jgi:hypothetical protein
MNQHNYLKKYNFEEFIIPFEHFLPIDQVVVEVLEQVTQQILVLFKDVSVKWEDCFHCWSNFL